ncbi:protein of unknown function [Dialister histaminiformans]|uniref:DUF4153 domain-containing protein n=1 Tax=Allisonella histaminiformans TaxID=209880 RepID=A0A1G5WLK9_9FIRM|nr:DUF4153 domain-containing protein [Allisonella histaminiformans]SDA58125.1 protein of unknown function [Allisonella histaminiformans]
MGKLWQWGIYWLGRAKQGVVRFRSASLWGFLLFLCWSGMSVWHKEDILYLSLFFSLAATMLLAAGWEFMQEERAGGRNEIIRYIPPALLCILLWGGLNVLEVKEYVIMAGLGLITAFMSMNLYVVSRNHRAGLFPILFLGALQAAGVSILSMAALSLCLAAVDAMLVSLPWYWWSMAAACSICIVGWNWFLASIPEENAPLRVPSSLKKLCQRVLFPVYGLYLLILYVYIGKILWLGTMPSGTMNWFGTLALLGYVLFYFLLGETEEVKGKSFFLYIGMTLLPIVTVQLLGVYIRYEAYGLTTLRYLSMACTVFGLASLFQGMRRKPIRNLWLLASALALLVTVTPANAIDVPVQNQKGRLYGALKYANMVQDGRIVEGKPEEHTRQQIRSAWQYIRRSPAVYADREVKALADSPVLARLGAEDSAEQIRVVHADSVTIKAKGASAVTWFEEPVASDGTLTVQGAKGKETFSVSPFTKQVLQEVYDGRRPNMEYSPRPGCRLLFLEITFQEGRAVLVQGMLAE